MKYNKGAASALMIVLVVAIVAIAGAVSYQAGLFNGLLGIEQSTIPGPVGSDGLGSYIGVNPTAAYSTKDKFASTSVGGTAYYKVGTVDTGTAATTTALTTVNPGSQYTYWVSNNTLFLFVKPKTFTATTLNNNVVNDGAYLNSTTIVTLTAYDLNGRSTISAAGGSMTYNVSAAANAVLNIEFTYQGISKVSNLPFGGIFVLELNSTVSTVTCSGDGVTASTPFHVTYSPIHTANKAVIFGLDETFDSGTGALRRVNCQIQNGGQLMSGVYRASILPANYYLTNTGDIALDVEQYKNDVTTRTIATSTAGSFTGNWTKG